MDRLSITQIKFVNDNVVEGSWKFNDETELVDVDGNFICTSQDLEDLHGIHFGVVTGTFNCGRNKLTSLAGAPVKVGNNFNCYNNVITSLKGAPRYVGGDFNCSDNRLTSLVGAPLEIWGDFDCYKNKLTSLELGPQIVTENFYCDGVLIGMRDEINIKKVLGSITPENVHWSAYTNLIIKWIS